MCDTPLSLCLVFDGLVLADSFTVFHGHLGLVGTHLFALPKILKQETTCTVMKLDCIQHLQMKGKNTPEHETAKPVIVQIHIRPKTGG